MSLFYFPSQVNERAARIVAGGVATAAAAALAARAGWIVPFLAVGFLLRVGWGPKFSPLARLAVWSAPKLWAVRPVAGPPKRFAQGIGATVTLAASALILAGYQPLGWGLVAVLVLFAALESGFSFCFGCWLFGQLQRLGVLAGDACVDCDPRADGPPLASSPSPDVPEYSDADVDLAYREGADGKPQFTHRDGKPY